MIVEYKYIKNIKNALVLSLIVIAILFIIVFLIAKSIEVPLLNHVKLMHELTSQKEDLTKRLDVHGNDEISFLAKAFNDFVDKLHDVIIALKKSTDLIANSSTEILSSCEKNTKDIVQQHNQT